MDRVVISWVREERRVVEKALRLRGLLRVRIRIRPRCGAGMSWVVRTGGGRGVVERWRGWGMERWRRGRRGVGLRERRRGGRMLDVRR